MHIVKGGQVSNAKWKEHERYEDEEAMKTFIRKQLPQPPSYAPR